MLESVPSTHSQPGHGVGPGECSGEPGLAPNLESRPDEYLLYVRRRLRTPLQCRSDSRVIWVLCGRCRAAGVIVRAIWTDIEQGCLGCGGSLESR
jgi:hypothetical protein